ncbi:MAG: Lrp/AsnC family transcriptional regulator [Candidatus Bathyarchaeota archaeon]|nr:Lrp/AsnC family transcriptional regulator [Candidatus Bathyarchaeum sp.]
MDTKILRDLLNDSRKSFREIAKEAGVSQDIIWQHYKKMKSQGIICGSTIQLDYRSLGHNAVGRITINVEPNHQDKVATKIKKIRNVEGVFGVKKEPEFVAVVELKTVEEIEEIAYLIKQVPFVTGLKKEIWLGIRSIPDNLSQLSSTAEKRAVSEKIAIHNEVKTQKSKIDQIDKQIIEKLGKNSRLSFRKIAQEIGISTDTVSRRFKKLYSKGIIKPLIQIDPTKIGYKATVFFSVSFISEQKLVNIVEIISQIPDIVLILNTSGHFDLFIMSLVKNVEQIFSIQEELYKIPGITELVTKIVKSDPILPFHCEHISNF